MINRSLNWKEEDMLKKGFNHISDSDYRKQAQQVLAKRKEDEINQIIEELKADKVLKGIRKKQSTCSHANIEAGDRSEYYRRICIDCGTEIY